MQNRKLVLSALLMLTAILASTPSLRAEEWGPWSVTGQSPALTIRGETTLMAGREPTREAPGISDSALMSMVRLYQVYISPVYGSRCPMYPTCSQYSIEAIKKHGSLLGALMTVGRLMHEADERRFVPLQKVGDRYRFMDPVSNNDFWFSAR
jgi:putative membrane protein insertion efficiency factor